MRQPGRGRLAAIIALSAITLLAVLVPLAQAQTSTSDADANCDGAINNGDVEAVLDLLTGSRGLAPSCATATDGAVVSTVGDLANGPTITVVDALALAQCVDGQGTAACAVVPPQPTAGPTPPPPPPPSPGCQINGVSVTTRLPQTECDALLALYRDLDGPNWERQDDWNTATDPCTWRFVNCDIGVFRLRLNDNGLEGQMPNEIGNLVYLDYLDLAENKISGMPASIGNLTRLEVLDVSGNSGSGSGLGPLPTSITNLKALTTFRARGAGIQTVPSTIGSMTALVELDLSRNQFGVIPTSIGNLSNLRILGLRSVGASSVPSQVGQLTKLESLDLSFNEIRSIPNTFGNLSALEELDIHANDIAGFPQSILTLTNLRSLLVQYNSLGSLPSDIGDLRNLEVLRADSSGLTSVPSSLGTISGLLELNLSRNALSSLPNSFGNLTMLEEVDLSRNQLNRLPQLNRLTRLKTLLLEFNRLPTLPSSLSALDGLVVFRATDNLISGNVSQALSGLTDTLEDIRLADGVGGNNCLTSSNSATTSWLNANDPGWNACA